MLGDGADLFLPQVDVTVVAVALATVPAGRAAEGEAPLKPCLGGGRNVLIWGMIGGVAWRVLGHLGHLGRSQWLVSDSVGEPQVPLWEEFVEM